MTPKPLHEIELEFQDKGVLRGSMLLLHLADAIAFARECRARRVAIHNVEAFIIRPGSTEPTGNDLGLGQASGDPADPDNCWSQTDRFLARYLKHPSAEYSSFGPNVLFASSTNPEGDPANLYFEVMV